MTPLELGLSDDACRGIHAASLQILDELGVWIDHEPLRRRLAGAGCRIVGERVHMPQAFVEGALARIPSSFTLYGRSTDHAVTVDLEHVLSTSTGIFANIRDFTTGEIRRSTAKDVADTTRILDALQNLPLVYVSLVDATEVPPHLLAATDFALTLENTTKPCVGPGVANRAEAEAIVAIARAVRGGDQALRRYPLCVPFVCAITPLRLPWDVAEALIVIAEAGLPLDALSNPVMGVSAPYTVAGTAAIGHAEVLAMACIAQVVAPGLPILTQNTPSVADMHTMGSTTGGPEAGLVRHTAMRLSRLLGIPCTAHGHTSSAYLDYQSGEEKALNSLLIAASRPSILGGIGALANVTLTAYETLVLDSERHWALLRMLDGVQVDADHLGYELIAGLVGGGSAMDSPHTLRYLRSREVWRPRLAVRKGLTGGQAPAETSLDRARAETERLLETHHVAPLPPSTQAELSAIVGELSSLRV